VTGTIADGFGATFTIGLTGAASNATGSQALTAGIVSARVTKAENGSRTVIATVTTDKAVTVHASLVREGKTIARATGHLTAGTHSVRVALGKSTAGGAATLRLVFAGENVTRTRKLSIPA
jgi:hypothetical protein